MRIPPLTLALLLSVSLCSSAEFAAPAVPDISQLPHPRIAVTSPELARLRAAYQGDDRDARQVVAKIVKEADAALKRPLEFPPRGGQHNQWYQCDKCQIALQTVDPTHHKCPKCSTLYTLTFDAAPGTEFLSGDGVGGSIVDRIPLIRATRRGTAARFAVVLEPTSGNAPPTVRSVSWKEDDARLQIEVVRDNHLDTINIGADWHITTTMPPQEKKP